MRWPAALGLGAALVLGPAGCRSTKHDVVEAELRARECDVRTLRDELDRSEFLNHALSRELSALRGLPGPAGVIEKPSEPYPVRSIRLGRGTAGRPSDCGGDDALQVQVEPIDCDNQVIKAPGSLYVEAIEVTKEGLKRPLSAWEVPPEELRRKYQSGLFNSGYMLTFPWKTPPTTEKLRVLARFRLVDGRIFEADKDISVRLLPEQRRPVLPAPSEVKPMLPAPEESGPIVPAVPPASAPATGGPILTSKKAGVEILRPVPMPEEP
jgi:hypothetical protein